MELYRHHLVGLSRLNTVRTTQGHKPGTGYSCLWLAANELMTKCREPNDALMRCRCPLPQPTQPYSLSLVPHPKDPYTTYASDCGIANETEVLTLFGTLFIRPCLPS
jgi:hypothetical protein